MGSYKLSGLMKKVRVVMDKNMTSTTLTTLGDVDTLSVDDIIKDSIPRAIRFILQSAPLYLIDTATDGTATAADGTAGATSGLTKTEQGDGYVFKFKLPDDFLRLVSVRLSDWKQNGRAITENDEEYFEQLSVYAGIRGNPSKPIAAIVQGKDGLYMELYSSSSDTASLSWFRYIAMPNISTDGDGSSTGDDDTSIELPSKLVNSIVYIAASLSLEILGEREQSDALRKTAYALAGIGDE